MTSEEIDALIAERAEARARQDWTMADAIRQILVDEGVQIEDYRGQTIWFRRRQ